jgi:hypothetical protein
MLSALAALPVAAHAAIYKWVDENGRTVYSNRPPANVKVIKNARVVVEDDAPKSPEEAQAEAAQHERDLERRIASLEQQLAERQYTPPPPPAQYYAPPPAPAPAYYGSPYYDPYYSGYGYPYYYGVPVGFVTVRRFAAPRFFVSRPIGFRGGHFGGGHFGGGHFGGGRHR